MRKLLLLVLPLVALSGPACGGCVDFTITPADLTCSVDGDCAAVGVLHVCPYDEICSQEHPVNLAAADRYTKAIGCVPRNTQVMCGAPTPVVCVQGQCKLKY